MHETAVVEDGSHLGTGAKVWHHAHVRTGAVIGDGCVLGKNVFVDADVEIGDGSRVQNNVSVYRGVRIGRNVLVGPSVVFTNDRYPRATSAEWDLVPTLVGDGASIGANATIICGIEIGPWSTVGAGAVVTKSVEPHSLVVGNPARPVGWVCRCGRVRSSRDDGPPTEACPHCGLHPEADPN